MSQTSIQRSFFFALLLGALLLTAFLFLPYLTTLSVAAVFTVILQPLYREALRITRGYRNVAAIITIAVAILLILAPVALIGTQIVREAQSVYASLTENPDALVRGLLDALQSRLRSFSPSLEIDVRRFATDALNWLVGNIGSLFSATANTIFQFFLGIIAFYYFLRDGPNFLETFLTVSPMPVEQGRRILRRLETAVTSIVRGTLVIAIVQGTLTGIGLAIFGIRSPTLWGALAGLGALLPNIGTPIILVPAVLYLFLVDRVAAGIGLAIWGIVAVGMVDNLLTPMLLSRGARIHPFVILFALIGGIGFFGPVGLILGPLVVSLLYALLDIFRKEYPEEATGTNLI